MHEWQEQLKLKDNLTEADIEALEKVLLGMPRMALTNTAKASKLKAAIAAGWVVEPPTEVGEFQKEKRYFYNGQNVDEMKPGAVRWLGDRIDDAYNQAVEIPPNL